MREIRTSGSVRGEEGNLLTYSTSGLPGPKRGYGVRNEANLPGGGLGRRAGTCQCPPCGQWPV